MQTTTNNFCNCCGGDFDETGIWMHDSKPVCFSCWCNLNKFEPDDILNDTRINISDISEEDWNVLREEYRDELSIMGSVDKYILDFMLSVSKEN